MKRNLITILLAMTLSLQLAACGAADGKENVAAADQSQGSQDDAASGNSASDLNTDESQVATDNNNSAESDTAGSASSEESGTSGSKAAADFNATDFTAEQSIAAIRSLKEKPFGEQIGQVIQLTDGTLYRSGWQNLQQIPAGQASMESILEFAEPKAYSNTDQLSNINAFVPGPNCVYVYGYIYDYNSETGTSTTTRVCKVPYDTGSPEILWEYPDYIHPQMEYLKDEDRFTLYYEDPDTLTLQQVVFHGDEVFDTYDLGDCIKLNIYGTYSDYILSPTAQESMLSYQVSRTTTADVQTYHYERNDGSSSGSAPEGWGLELCLKDYMLISEITHDADDDHKNYYLLNTKNGRSISVSNTLGHQYYLQVCGIDGNRFLFNQYDYNDEENSGTYLFDADERGTLQKLAGNDDLFNNDTLLLDGDYVIYGGYYRYNEQLICRNLGTGEEIPLGSAISDNHIWEVGDLDKSHENLTYRMPDGSIHEFGSMSATWIVLRDEDAASRKINNTIQDIVTDLASGYRDDVQEQMADVAENADTYGDYLPTFYQDIALNQITYLSDEILCMTGNCDDYYGGAHGMPYEISVIFDRKTGDVLKITDLVEESGEEIIERMIPYLQRMVEEEEGGIDSNAAEVARENGISSPTIWITEDGFVFGYGVYEMAAFARGFVEVEVPFSEFTLTRYL